MPCLTHLLHKLNNIFIIKNPLDIKTELNIISLMGEILLSFPLVMRLGQMPDLATTPDKTTLLTEAQKWTFVSCLRTGHNVHAHRMKVVQSINGSIHCRHMNRKHSTNLFITSTSDRGNLIPGKLYQG